MNDADLIRLFWQRSEDAVKHTLLTYGSYCRTIAKNILHNEQDAEECVNDTMLKTWNAIPPHRPARLSAFLAKITRHTAIDRLAYASAEKRSGSCEPLEEWCRTFHNLDDFTDTVAVTDALNRFLQKIPSSRRRLFLQRYWYCRSITELVDDFGLSESNIKMQLLRTREELRIFLEKEGIYT